MRLLNTLTHQLESFLGTEKPQYAILSHTWEPEGEILFDDLQLPPTQLHSKAGWSKVKNTCDRAVLDGYDYVWIDTLCIDKSSSAELSEAINSMFVWYKRSEVCYALLSDVDSISARSNLSKSRWFTRGWTLQELIAPWELIFYDMNWNFLGSRLHLASEITSITQIPRRVLIRSKNSEARIGPVLQSTSVAHRMSWASKRVTTREEDLAYSLMGIFDVNMPLLYGEGKRAFLRLQEAIMYASKDQSILAFRHPEPPARMEMWLHGFSPILAPDPSYFCDDIRQEVYGSNTHTPMKLDNGNITLEVFIVPIAKSWKDLESTCSPTHVALLDCVCGEDDLSRPGLLLQAVDHEATHFKRCAARAVIVKATLESIWSIKVVGTGNTPPEEHAVKNKVDRDLNKPVSFECDLPLDDSTKVKRKLITIEKDRSDAHRPFERGPLVLDYGRVLKHCAFKCASPKSNEKYRDVFLWSSVGVAVFTHRDVDFIVAWGADTEPWCKIHLYDDLVGHDEFPFEWDSAGARCNPQELLNYLERAELLKQSMIDIFKRPPLLWSQPFSITTGRGRSGVQETLTITGSSIHCEFVGRQFRRLRLFAKIEPTHQTSEESKSWFRKTAKKQEDDPKYPLRVIWGGSDDCK